MKKIAFLFPGQGSQKVGMGRDIYDESAVAREIFELAESVTGLPIKRLCFEGPMQELTETVNLQPAVTAVNLAVLGVLRERGVRPDVVAGHSLGEYSALCAAGALSAADTFSMVLKRGQLMHREAGKHNGAMSAIIGLTLDRVEALVAANTASGVVSVANHNTETQIVITGQPEAVALTAAAAKASGAKAVPLKVSGAWHSELIRGSVEDFRAHLETADIFTPDVPVIMNVTADFCTDPARLRQLLAEQLCSPVRWYDAMLRLMGKKVDTFVEIGPGAVLTGLTRKIIPDAHSCTLHSINSMTALEAFLQQVC